MNNFPPYPSYQALGVKWRRKAGVLGVTIDGNPTVVEYEPDTEQVPLQEVGGICEYWRKSGRIFWHWKRRQIECWLIY